MPFSPDITELWSNFKNLVKKVSYDKAEVDDKLSDKSDINHTHIINDVSNLQSTLDNKAPSSHVHSRLVPTNIPENADLNDYTTQGSFYCSMNDTARTLKNCPVTEAFHLECYRHAGVRQVLQTFSPTSVRTFERNYYAAEGGHWSEWYQIINQSSVDSSLSASSTNPVQNKVVNAQLTSLNNNKANINHTHNNYTATTTVACSYGTVRKFKKNGWAFVVWENIDISSIPNNTWIVLADIGWSNQAGNSFTGNFQTQDATSNRLRINVEGQLQAWRMKESSNMGHYGYIVYPTSD